MFRPKPEPHLPGLVAYPEGSKLLQHPSTGEANVEGGICWHKVQVTWSIPKLQSRIFLGKNFGMRVGSPKFYPWHFTIFFSKAKSPTGHDFFPSMASRTWTPKTARKPPGEPKGPKTELSRGSPRPHHGELDIGVLRR